MKRIATTVKAVRGNILKAFGFAADYDDMPRSIRHPGITAAPGPA
jgi:hypothetical protein